ncbi:MAG: hypothetical protein KGS61_18580, partial [Verrucomicrobia bacterium]|nr:hypothetical protein [Verrucomicrobiota bacterium]
MSRQGKKRRIQASDPLREARQMPSTELGRGSHPAAATGPITRAQVSPQPDAPASPILKPASSDTEHFQRLVAFDVVDKQYRLYGWVDTKNQALITT